MELAELEALYQEHLQGLAAGALLSFIAVSWAYFKGFFKIKPLEIIPPAFLWRKTVVAFALFLSLELFFAPLAFIFWQKAMHITNASPYIRGWANIFAFFVTALGIFLYVFSLHQYTRKLILGDWTLRNFAFGAMTWLIAYPVVLMLSQVLSIVVLYITKSPHIDQVAVTHLKDLMQYPDLFISTILSVAIVVPFIEETIFRGFLQTSLKSFLSRRTSIIITSLIFSLFHFSSDQGFDNIELLSSLFILSCFLGFIYERQKSLLTPYALHMTFNGISTLMIAFQDA